MTNTYDSDGQRVAQSIDGDVTNFLWDTLSPYGDVVVEYDSLGNPLVDYVLGGTRLISQHQNSATSYYLQDGQGSTRTLTNQLGNSTDSYTYDAFGELTASTGTTTNKYLYTGQQFDTVTGLYSLRARHYSPSVGRFLSQDMWPYNFNNPMELNRYGYAANNVINFFDPSGLNASGESSTINIGVGKFQVAVTREFVEGFVTGAVSAGIGSLFGNALGAYINIASGKTISPVAIMLNILLDMLAGAVIGVITTGFIGRLVLPPPFLLYRLNVAIWLTLLIGTLSSVVLTVTTVLQSYVNDAITAQSINSTLRNNLEQIIALIGIGGFGGSAATAIFSANLMEPIFKRFGVPIDLRIAFPIFLQSLVSSAGMIFIE